MACCSIEIMKEMTLPEPWEDVPFAEDSGDYGMVLENAAKVFRSCANGPYPNSKLLTFDHWLHLHNSATSVDVFIHLQNMPFSQRWEATSVYFSAVGNNSAVTGSELRKLPLSTICSIYGSRFNETLIATTRKSALIDYGKIPDITEPLPKVGKRKGPFFYALVGMQFDELKRLYPDENIADIMRKLNDAPLSTVQRWIAKARNMNMLAAAQWVKD